MRWGNIHTRIPGTVTPPAVCPTFDTIKIQWTPTSEDVFFIGQLYFGESGTTAAQYTNKTTFLTDHPALTLDTFSGVAAPGGTAALPAFSGFSIDDDFSLLIYDSAALTPHMPWCALGGTGGQFLITMVFDPPINSAGMNLGTREGLGNQMSVEYLNGETLLYGVLTTPNAASSFSTFSGFSRGCTS